MKIKDGGFTLVEVLIVVAILGILAGIAAFSMINALDRSRQGRTMADLHAIAVALESYATDSGFYPSGNGDPVSSITPLLEPTYLRPVPENDGWSHPVLYASDGSTFTLLSRGADGALSQPWPGGPTHRTTADIILVDGQFFQWPEGVQSR